MENGNKMKDVLTGGGAGMADSAVDIQNQCYMVQKTRFAVHIGVVREYNIVGLGISDGSSGSSI